MRTELQMSWNRYEHSMRALLLGTIRTALVSLVALSASVEAIDIKVPAQTGVTNAIQDAIEQCPDNDPSGCRIILQGRSYTLANSLFIRNKSNITITSATSAFRPELIFQDDGSKAGPESHPDTVNFKPAGWKRWPFDGSDNVGGSGCAAQGKNPFTTSGIQRNGTILIQGSHNILIENVVVNGKAPIGWGSLSVWESNYPTFYGNFGINLYLSGKVTVRNCEIKNCFSALYIMNRNKGGVLAHNNAADCDKTLLAPGSRYGEMGGHVIEQSVIHDNIWAGYEESGDDLGNTWRFNKIYNNHNTSATYEAWMTGAGSPCYNSSNHKGTAGVCKNDEAKNHVGGFLFLKDNVGAPDRVYNNTFWRITNLLGWGGWRGGTQHYFYNNIVSEPWFDYNGDSSAFLTENFIKQFKDKNLTTKMGDFAYNNTFAYFPVIDMQNNPPLSKTSCAGAGCAQKIATLKAAVWPTGRMVFQSQEVQGTNFTINGQSKYLQPLSKLYYIDQIQYQGEQRKFAIQGWKLEAPPTSDIQKVDYSATVPAADNGTATGTNQTFNYKGRDSSLIALRLGRLFGLPDADTIGMLLGMGASLDTGKYRTLANCYMKSIPMDLNPNSKTFLMPVWADKGVDSCVEGKAWAPGGASFTSGGKAASRGAVQPDGVIANQVLTITDDQPLFINEKLATASFNLSSSVAGLTNLEWVFAQFIPTVPFGDGGTEFTGTAKPIAIPVTSFSKGPVLGANQVSIQLPAEAKGYSRIEAIVAGIAPDGQKVMSNLAVWIVRQSDLSIKVSFHAAKFAGQKTVDTVIAGKPVWMRLEPLQHLMTTEALPADSCTKLHKVNAAASCDIQVDKTIRYGASMNMFSLKGQSLFDKDPLDAGAVAIAPSGLYGNGSYPSSGTDSAGTNVMWLQVWFTKAGAMAPVATALGQGSTDKVFQGLGSIYVRPDVPYRARLEDPVSYNTLGDNDSLPLIPFKTKYKTTVSVLDRFDNQVDVSSRVTLSTATANPLKIYVGGGTAAQTTLDVPNTGKAATVVQAVELPPPETPLLNWFWLYANLGSSTTPDAGTYKDSSKVHVGKANMLYAWGKDSLNTWIKDTVRVTLSILDADGKLFPASGKKAAVWSRSGSVKFYLGTDVGLLEPLDSVDLDALGSVELLVTSPVETLDDEVYAGNIDVNSGEPATMLPVHFRKPPEPPYPLFDSAAYVDTDCDGKADKLRVWLQASATSGSADLDTSKTPVHSLTLTVGGKAIAYDSTEWTFAPGRKDLLVFPVKGIVDSASPSSTDLELQYTMRNPPLDDVVVTAGTAGTVKDRVAPMLIDTAFIVENPNRASGTADTLKVLFTEPMKYTGSSWPFQILDAGGSGTVSGSTLKISAVIPDAVNPRRLKIVFTGNAAGIVNEGIVTLRLDPTGSLKDHAGNVGIDVACAQPVPVKETPIPQPIVASAIHDKDGDGAADWFDFSFARKLRPKDVPEAVVVAWAGTSKRFGKTDFITNDSIHWHIDFQTAPFQVGVTYGPGSDGVGSDTLIASGRYEAYDMTDSVGPVVAMASLQYGRTSKDTLSVTFSEPVVVGVAGNWMVKKDISGASISMNLAETGSDASAKIWRFLVDTTDAGYPNPGDSIRLPASPARIASANNGGVLPAPNAPWVPVIAGDRGPDSAWYSDESGAGTATRLTMVFRRPLKNDGIFRFQWGDTELVDTVRVADVAGKAVIVLELGGRFKTGVTRAASEELGLLTSILVGSMNGYVPAPVAFQIKDRVVPFIDTALLVYGTYEDAASSFDTLWLKFTEPVRLADGDASLALAMKAVTGNLALTPLRIVLTGSDRGYALFDTTEGQVAPGPGDSIRIQKDGTLGDMLGNIPGEVARYCKVVAGARKAIVPKVQTFLNNSDDATASNNLSALKPLEGTSPLASLGSNLAIVSRRSDDKVTGLSVPGWASTWSQLKGTVGVEITMNIGSLASRSTLTALLYDSYGVFLGKADAILRPEEFTTSGNGAVADRTGKFSLEIVWDGRAANGSIATSGVYTMRVILFKDEIYPNGEKRTTLQFNALKKIGVSR